MKELYTEAELRRLIAQEEGQFLEFKSLWHLEDDTPKPLDRRTVRDWIAEYVAAFANADGGTILLGVDDDGTPSGHAYPEDAVQEFLAGPERRLRPSVKVQTQRIVLDTKQVIVFQVHMHPEAIMADGNGFPYRVDDEVIREPQEVINNRKQAYRRVGYEQRVRPEASLNDIDLSLAKSFLSKSVQADRPVEELLEMYGLILPKAGVRLLRTLRYCFSENSLFPAGIRGPVFDSFGLREQSGSTAPAGTFSNSRGLNFRSLR